MSFLQKAATVAGIGAFGIAAVGAGAEGAAASGVELTGVGVVDALAAVGRFVGTAIVEAAAGQGPAAAGGAVAAGAAARAAKSGASALDSIAPAVRCNVDDAIARASSGKVRFPGRDEKVYNNSDGLLPRGGSYTEWTAAEAGAKRGAHRVIIDGDPASPNAIYYWNLVNPPARIGP